MYTGYERGYGRSVFSRRRRIPVGWILLALLLAAAAVLAAYTAFDNGRCVVRRQRVLAADLPPQLEGFTVLHVSDLGGKMLGTNHSELMRALKGAQWDAVVCTGNMLGKTQDPYPFYDLISVIGTDKPFYFIAGLSDPAAVGREEGFYTVVSDWAMGALSRGAVYLDRPQKIEKNGHSIWLTEPSLLTFDLSGTLAAYTTSGTLSGEYWQQVVNDTLTAREQMETDCDLHLLVSAEPLTPSSADIYLKSEDGDFVRTVDLVLAGGTAGGQWRLPGLGGVWSQGKWFPKEQLRGYEHTASLLQCVSAGLGVDPASPLPAFRLFNTPEVSLITFTSQIDLDTLP